MPYISKENRVSVNDDLDALIDSLGLGDRGEYNYVISNLVHQFAMDRSHEEGKPLCYAALNDALGLIEAVKASFLHTVYHPYEDKKRLENGGISELDRLTPGDVR